MCCFSTAVNHVFRTRIFARRVGEDRQILVYAMSIEADADLAMILPLPVPPSPPEDAVRFIDLSGYPTFFDDVDRAFLLPAGYVHDESEDEKPAPKAPLVVHEVGAFEASFVPRIKDFDRLDPRFRLPRQVWDRLPGYKSYGFAVFKLRPAHPRRVENIHPMAFELPVRPGLRARSRAPRLFFPTVHVHDGEVHPTAAFDHVLYFQGSASGYEAGRRLAREVVDVARAAGVVDGRARVYRRMLNGQRKNEDTFVELSRE